MCFCDELGSDDVSACRDLMLFLHARSLGRAQSLGRVQSFGRAQV
ncbi:MAG: hypothetical protein U0L51_07885 [Olegusella sp.]|nr:hypothetical protein [Olegusella sp.]